MIVGLPFPPPVASFVSFLLFFSYGFSLIRSAKKKCEVQNGKRPKERNKKKPTKNSLESGGKQIVSFGGFTMSPESCDPSRCGFYPEFKFHLKFLDPVLQSVHALDSLGPH